MVSWLQKWLNLLSCFDIIRVWSDRFCRCYKHSDSHSLADVRGAQFFDFYMRNSSYWTPRVEINQVMKKSIQNPESSCLVWYSKLRFKLSFLTFWASTAEARIHCLHTINPYIHSGQMISFSSSRYLAHELLCWHRYKHADTEVLLRKTEHSAFTLHFHLLQGHRRDTKLHHCTWDRRLLSRAVFKHDQTCCPMTEHPLTWNVKYLIKARDEGRRWGVVAFKVTGVISLKEQSFGDLQI